MKTALSILPVAIALALTPNPCFAVWDVAIVTQESAKELGLEFRSTAAGSKHVRVELEFKTDGELKDFSEVELTLGKGDNLTLRTALQEDRSKPGRVAVRFTVESAQLNKLTLQVRVPYRDGGLGGAIYELAVKDFVDLKKAP